MTSIAKPLKDWNKFGQKLCFKREIYYNKRIFAYVFVISIYSFSYFADYLRHAPCMRQVQDGYERCADDYQIRIRHLNEGGATGAGAEAGAVEEEENVQLLCCSFQNYLHCSEKVVNSTCGHETAKFTKGFLDRMSGPLIQVWILIHSADPQWF